MEKLYNKIDFVNNTTPALNATNLNRMSKGLDDLDNRVIDLAADIMDVGPAAEAAMEAAGTAVEAAETASGASETATGAATSAEGYASDAKSWAVGPSGAGTGTDTNNAKYWAEQAAGAVSGVSSFNGRSGAVTPQSGDYTADQVGAIAKESTLPTPSSDYVNKIVQYVGATSGGFVHGYFYECVNNGGTYSWVEAKVQADVDPSNKADISAIGTNETGATCSNPNGYSSGDHFYKNGKFCTAIATIAQGATFTINTNYVEGTIADAITALNSSLIDVTEFNDLSSFTTYTGSRISDRSPSDMVVKYKQKGNIVYLYIDFSSIPSSFRQYTQWDQWSILWGSTVDTLPIPQIPTQLYCVDQSGAFCSANIVWIGTVSNKQASKVLILGNPSLCDLHDGEKMYIYGWYST